MPLSLSSSLSFDTRICFLILDILLLTCTPPTLSLIVWPVLYQPVYFRGVHHEQIISNTNPAEFDTVSRRL